MPEYRITEKAGRFVAGQTNNGAGTSLFLTEKQAAYELALGTIVPAVPVAEAPAPEPAEAPAEEPPAAAPKKRGKGAASAAPVSDTPENGEAL